MEQQVALIETLAIGLGVAFIGGMLARRLRLPTIVGYLAAGIAVGPFTPGLVADPEVVPQLAELGVILLMFGVGIHFSIPDLLAVRGIAVPGAVAHSVVATILGAVLGVALGWGLVGGLVLGLAISVASTVVLLRALTERNELDTPQGRIAIGFVIVEDIFTIVVLVLLPTLEPLLSGQGGVGIVESLQEVLVALVKAAIFSALMLYAGRRIVPWILGAVARERSRELFTLAVLAMAVGIAFVASTVFGVSFALGAFLGGVVLSESDLSHQAAADALPLRDAFAVLFFVSVGMLMDPGFLVREPVAVLAVTLLIVGAKSVTAFAIVAAFGYPVRVSLTVSAALAQVGEFSFILASLGRALDLIPPDAFQLVVAGALVSIALNALLFRLVEPLEALVRARPALLAAVERRPRGLSHLYPARRDELRAHAILCGYGRVGRLVAAALERRGFQYVVVSDDRREIERLRARGISALYGDAANEELLEEARLALARVVIVALADVQAARLVVDRVRSQAPRVPLVVRTHSAPEASFLRGLGPTVQSVHAEREVAIQLTRFSLRRFGLSTIEVDAIASGLRDREWGEPGRVAPARETAGTRAAVRAWVARLAPDSLRRRVDRPRPASTSDGALQASTAPEPARAERPEGDLAAAPDLPAAAVVASAPERARPEPAAVDVASGPDSAIDALLAPGAADVPRPQSSPMPMEAATPTETTGPSAPSPPPPPSAPSPPPPSLPSAAARRIRPLRDWFERWRAALSQPAADPASTTAPDATADAAQAPATLDSDARATGAEPAPQQSHALPARSPGGGLDSLRRWIEGRRSALSRLLPPPTSAPEAAAEQEEPRAVPAAPTEPTDPATQSPAKPQARPGRSRTKPRPEPAGAAPDPLEPGPLPAVTPRTRSARPRTMRQPDERELPPAGELQLPLAEAGTPPVDSTGVSPDPVEAQSEPAETAPAAKVTSRRRSAPPDAE